MHVLIYSALAIVFILLNIAKWSVVKMTREINRLALPSGEKLMREKTLLWWWPNYKDRRIWKIYRSLQPYSGLRWVYPGALVFAGLIFLTAVLVSAHAPGVR